VIASKPPEFNDLAELESMTAEDAVCGVEGIIVSNHGRRALDTPVGTMDVLPSIVAALDQANAHPEVYVDGGFRHGGEVVVALASAPQVNPAVGC